MAPAARALDSSDRTDDGSPGPSACSVCEGNVLTPHLRVRPARAEALIPSTDRYGAALAHIARCESCGHMQLERIPARSELLAAYEHAASDDYIQEEAGQRATARRVLGLVERHVARGRLLDLGTWVGFLLAEARARGWETLGVEPSAFASSFAREQLGLDVRTEDLFDAELPAHAFDAVVLGDVIEHLPDPGAALDHVAHLLAPGGLVCLTLPDAGSRLARLMGSRWWSVIPTHVQYFTRHSISTLLRRHGFAVLEMQTAPKAFTVRYYLERLGGYSQSVASALVAAAEAADLTNRIWAPDFRDRMCVVARAG